MEMKKGQGSSTTAGLIATIAGLIVLYIIFLPPDERANLLGDSSTSNRISSGGSAPISESPFIANKTIFRVSPGKIFYQKLDEYEYDLASFTLSRKTNAQTIEQVNNFRIRNGWFDKIRKNVSFTINNLDNTDNVVLTMNMPRHAGILTIQLNDQEIYQFEGEATGSVGLPKDKLKNGQNNLEFSVSGVGGKFWSTNEYDFSDVKILGEITDTSKEESRNSFYISQEEANNLDKSEIKFNPECKTNSVGVLEVNLNGKNIFTGIPDCGILNSYDFSPSSLNIGRNTVNFKTQSGTYLIDNVKVKTTLKQPVQPTFYFEMEDKFFNGVQETEAKCGDIDGICPTDCSYSLDYDCCLKEYPQGYWCDVKTNLLADRCVGFVEDCKRCKSGYRDSDGNAAKACEGLCGDNTDGECPRGCLPKYDKDCCYNLNGDQYFCKTLPVTGEDYRCMNELTQSTCQNCFTGYESENIGFSCEASTQDKTQKLKSGLNIILIFSFTDSSEDKEAELWVNGKMTSFSTRESSYRKNINLFIEPGTNSIEIKPKTDLDIRQLEVKFD